MGELSEKEEIVIRSGVWGLGFIGGVFTSAGVSPSGAILDALKDVISPGLCILIGIVLLALSIVKLLSVFYAGGFLSVVAVAIAFASGYYIFSPTTEIGVILLFVAIGLGYLAVYLAEHKS